MTLKPEPLELQCPSPEHCVEVARCILNHFPQSRLVLLEGGPGAGKTTLVQAFLKHWGVSEPVTSPTFTLVHTYHNDLGQSFAHLDLYRIHSEAEAQEAGLSEVIAEPHRAILVEWPSHAPGLFLDIPHLHILISQEEGGGRHLRVEQRN
ncbi:MAG: tRNA (adenosine(37)-N6)-threonylcarbamoyltransferase complex ATPase subunit type 1 TsaE [Flavobacteriales bacterium]|nr:tRNA (adenosine(37)-N6)-threonylcarbamoyltransferase complex ATPase subunit type 1 TsaE [Flavobacteriales bacterium]MDW8409144.1 tRNA (adenosine(37)-N6)-threonylcarbamoyltransferase complex ATPase subunit type 1 TsaE [Flavobacteriales bacterium]